MFEGILNLGTGCGDHVAHGCEPGLGADGVHIGHHFHHLLARVPAELGELVLDEVGLSLVAHTTFGGSRVPCQAEDILAVCADSLLEVADFANAMQYQRMFSMQQLGPGLPSCQLAVPGKSGGTGMSTPARFAPAVGLGEREPWRTLDGETVLARRRASGS